MMRPLSPLLLSNAFYTRSLCLNPPPPGGGWIRRHAVKAQCEKKNSVGEMAAGKKRMDRVKGFVADYYLPLASLLGMGIGCFFPFPGVYLHERNFSNYCTTGVFIVSGLLLERGEASKAFDSRGALLLGLVLILLMTPCVAPLIHRLALQPKELMLGLAIFTLTPTTLSSGVALIQAAGANVAMAILLTLTSNFLAVFTMPLTLSFLLGYSNHGALPLILLKNLILSILAPTLIAYFAKNLIQGGEEWIRRRKKKVSYLGTAFLTLIPWMQVSRASQNGIPTTAPTLALAALIGIFIHLLFLISIHFLVHALHIGGHEPASAVGVRRSVILMSSQKSLTIALAVMTQLSPVLGSEKMGIACIPCVLVHFGQTIIDAIVASHWAKSQNPQLKTQH